MIETTKVNGRPAVVAYLRGDWEPCAKTDATFIKVMFQDRPQVIFLKPKPKEEFWDESQHPREPAGTETGGQFAPAEGGGAAGRKSEGTGGKKVSDFHAHAAAYKAAHAQYAKTGGYSYDPKSGKAYTLEFDPEKKEANKVFHDTLATKPDDDVVIVGVTNNNGDIEAVQSIYDELSAQEHAMLGNWTDDSGNEFNDVSVVKSGATPEETKALLNKYHQQSALVLHPDGSFEFVSAT